MLARTDTKFLEEIPGQSMDSWRKQMISQSKTRTVTRSRRST